MNVKMNVVKYPILEEIKLCEAIIKHLEDKIPKYSGDPKEQGKMKKMLKEARTHLKERESKSYCCGAEIGKAIVSFNGIEDEEMLYCEKCGEEL